ncbi:MAG TPA: hypothetical protein VMH38_06880 [Thermoplasmata archaeon]|nr:hypothetical protein [Thermoplasmata archaeon]
MTEIDGESLAREREDRERRENDRELDAFEGAVVAVYTRAQAIEDGLLVDVSEVAREVGNTRSGPTHKDPSPGIAPGEPDRAGETYIHP